MNKKNITITGYYGFNNFGDDLFPLAVVNFLEGYKQIKVNVLSPEIESVKANYLVPKWISSHYKKKNVIGKLIRFVMMFYAALISDTVLLAGGSVISSNSSNSMRKFQYCLSKFKVCKFGAVGVSVGPFNNDIDYKNAQKFLSELVFILVRDEESFNIVKKMGYGEKLYLSLDIAGLVDFTSYDVVANDATKNCVSISVCNYESYVGGDTDRELKRNEAVISAFISFCKEKSIENVKIIVLNSNENVGDKNLSLTLSERLVIAGINYEFYTHQNPYLTIREIRKTSLFISMRLHGAIVAFLNSIPFVLIEYHKKCFEFNNIALAPENIIDTENAKELKIHLCELHSSGNKLKLSPRKYSQEVQEAFFNILNKL